MRSQWMYVFLLGLQAGLLGMCLTAVAQDRPPGAGRPIVPPDEPIGKLPNIPSPPSRQGPTPPVPSPPPPKDDGINRTNFERPAAFPQVGTPLPLPRETPPRETPTPASALTRLPETPKNDAALPEIPLPNPVGPAPPPLFPKESVEPRQTALPETAKPGANAPSVKPEAPLVPVDPPKSRAEAPLPSPAAQDPAGAPGAVKEPPRFTFPIDPPAASQPAASQAAVNLDPPKPPAFRVVAASRRPAAPQLPLEPRTAGTTVRPGATVNGSSSPTLVVEKHGPSSARVGQVVSYEIIVRNEGVTSAQRIRVEDEIPSRARLVVAHPQPVVHGDRALWTLDTLEPGHEARIRVDLLPSAAGEIVSSASVLLGSSTARTMVTSGSTLMTGSAVPTGSLQTGGVSLKVQGPEKAAAGEMVEFEVRIANAAPQTVTGLVLRVRLPSGLLTSWGPDIEADLGDLPPGGTKTIKLPAKAVLQGRQVVDVSLLSGSTTLTNTRAIVVVGQNALVVRRIGDNRAVVVGRTWTPLVRED